MSIKNNFNSEITPLNIKKFLFNFIYNELEKKKDVKLTFKELIHEDRPFHFINKEKTKSSKSNCSNNTNLNSDLEEYISGIDFDVNFLDSDSSYSE